jgi:hypothetical protein
MSEWMEMTCFTRATATFAFIASVAVWAPSPTAAQAPISAAGQAPISAAGQAPISAAGQAPISAAGQAPISAAGQAPLNVYDLADYRLTSEVFEHFVQASGRIAEITRQDSAFTYAPLFTKDVALDGDAVAMATGLIARLENHTGLAAALQAAKITPREYSKFALGLVAAHLAHNFLKTGALQRVPAGAPTTNVEFVKTHEAEVTAVLAELGIRD